MRAYHNSARFGEASLLGVKALELDKKNHEAMALLYLSIAKNRVKKISTSKYDDNFIALSPNKKYTLIWSWSSNKELRLSDSNTKSQITLASIPSVDGDEEGLRFAFFTDDSKRVVFGMRRLHVFDITSSYISPNDLQGCSDNAFQLYFQYTGYHRIDNDKFALNCGSSLHIIDTHSLRIRGSASIAKPSDLSAFIPHSITNCDITTDGEIIAYTISGQSDNYTGEADNMEIIQIVNLRTGIGVGYIPSGLVTDIKFYSRNKLLVAKDGGRLELWDISTPATGLQQEKSVDNKASKIAPSYRFEQYNVLMDPADAHLYELSANGYKRGPNMHRIGGSGLSPMRLARLGDSYAYLLNGTLAIFDVELNHDLESSAENPASIQVKSLVPVLKESDFDETDFYYSNYHELIIKNTNIKNKTTFVAVEIESKEWIEDIESLVEQVAKTMNIFKYLGIENWNIGCDQRTLFVTFKVADTRFSTSEYVIEINLKESAEYNVYPYKLDRRSNKDKKNGNECDGTVDFEPIKAHEKTWATELTGSVDGSGAVSTHDHNFVIFRRGNRLTKWRNTNIVEEDISQLVRELETSLQLSLDQNFTPKLNDAVK